MLGPTFQNLADNVHKNVTDIYYIFVGRSLGYLGGSVLGGILFDHVNAHLLLGECGSEGGRGRGAPLGLSSAPLCPPAGERAAGRWKRTLCCAAPRKTPSSCLCSLSSSSAGLECGTVWVRLLLVAVAVSAVSAVAVS